jgi:hypothetical protein
LLEHIRLTQLKALLCFEEADCTTPNRFLFACQLRCGCNYGLSFILLNAFAHFELARLLHMERSLE